MKERRSAMTHSTNHYFDPLAIPGLPRRGREIVNAAFEAMSDWRSEIAESNKKNTKRVIKKMAAAAEELGLPEQAVDAARTQMQNLTRAQNEAMDQVTLGRRQLILSNAASPSGRVNMLKSSSGSPGSWPGDAFQAAVMTPLQFWMQWQKSCTDVMTSWTKGARSSDRAGRRD
jgi:hypothetical protein